MADKSIAIRLSVQDDEIVKRALRSLGADGQKALARIETAAAPASQALLATGPAATRAGAQVGLAAHQMQNLSFQVNDLAQQLATGQSPFRAILQQGSQIVQIFDPRVGVGGALKATGTAIASFLVNPLTLATIGFAVAAQAAASFFSSVGDGADDVENALERHEDIVKRIRDAYGDAAKGAKAYDDESRKVVAFVADRNAETLRKQLQVQARGILFGSGLFDGGLFAGADEFGERQLNPGLERFAGAIGVLQKSSEDGTPAVGRYREELVALARARPEVAAMVEEMLRLSEAADKTERAFGAARKLSNILGPDDPALGARGARDEAGSAAALNQLAEDRARDQRRERERRKSEGERLARAAETKAESERNRIRTEGIRLTEQTATAEERYAASVADAGRLLAARAITEETYTRAIAAAGEERLAASTTWTDGLRRGLAAVRQDAADMAAQIEDAVTSAFAGAEDALTDFVTTGKADFKALADSILKDLARIAIRQGIASALGAIGGGPANILPTGIRSFFAGFRADGGPVPAGKFAFAGEEGVEVVTGPGTVLSQKDLRNALSGGGAAGVSAVINADFRGAEASAVAALSSKLAQLESALPGMIVRTVAHAQVVSPGRIGR